MSATRADEQAILSLRQLYAAFGYSQYKMSRFEEYELYVRNKDFLISDQVITFTDRSGRLLALKPDVTLSIIKNADPAPGTVRKVYYHENVYRVDPASHAFREIPQVGLECIGDLSEYDIAETVLLALRSLELMSPDYFLELSHMGLVSAMLSASGLAGRDRQRALELLRQKNAHELTALCREKGARSEKLEALLLDGSIDVLEALRPLLDTPEETEAFEEFSRLCNVLRRCGAGERLRVNFSVTGQVKYYCAAVFKGYLPGIEQSVLSGGQYDKLLQKLGKAGSAVGFAVYADLLQRLPAAEEMYDVDALLLYSEQDDPAQVLAAIGAIGGKVLASRRIPEKLRYRRLLRLEQGEAREIANG